MDNSHDDRHDNRDGGRPPGPPTRGRATGHDTPPDAGSQRFALCVIGGIGWFGLVATVWLAMIHTPVAAIVPVASAATAALAAVSAVAGRVSGGRRG